jgi:hypothetical protein
MSALAQPLGDPRYRRGTFDQLYTVTLRRDQGVSLRGFTVPSNSERDMHSEQMFDLGGSLRLVGDAAGGYRLENQTSLTFQDVGVIQRGTDRTYQSAWLGTLRPKTAVPVRFEAAPDNQPYVGQWREADALRPRGGATQRAVSLRRLVELATTKLSLGPGEVRLLGWTDQELPGLEIRPQISQQTLRTLALIHLQPGQLPVARPDANLRENLSNKPVQTDDPLEANAQGPMTNDQ